MTRRDLIPTSRWFRERHPYAASTPWALWPRAIACGLAITCMAHGQRTDTIYAVGGTTQRAKIVKVTPTEVVAQIQGKEQSIPTNTIAALAFREEPVAMRQAREALNDGQFDQAAQALERIDTKEIAREEIRQEVAYLGAYLKAREAIEGDGDLAAAAAAVLAFLKDNKTSYHFFPAIELIGDLEMQAGDFVKARKYYGSLSRAPWTEAKMKAFVLEGDALRAQGETGFGEARVRYERVLGVTATSAEMKRQHALAKVGQAVCQAEAGQTGEAIATLEALVMSEDASDVKLFARIYNALGDSHRLAGQPQAAVLDYLHVDLLFFRDSQVHAEALFRLEQLWRELGEPGRANEARALLQSRYGNSWWASR